MKNNNKAVIRKLTGRILTFDIKHYLIIAFAIMLTTLMITSVLSLGMSIYATNDAYLVRSAGAKYHLTIAAELTQEQHEKLGTLDYVAHAGKIIHIGAVNEIPDETQLNLSLEYYDTAEWEHIRKPAVDNVVGAYPQLENEIMMPVWVLNKLGIPLEVGAEVKLPYRMRVDGEMQYFDGSFILSGYFTNYTSTRQGNVDNLLVSRALAAKCGYADGFAHVVQLLFKDEADMTGTRIYDDLKLGENQSGQVYSATTSDDSSAQMAQTAGILLIVLFIAFTGYLLIYNALNISVARDTRFYGLLKSIGTTPKQIGAIVKGQIVRLSAVGIATGMLLSVGVTTWLIPLVLDIAVSSMATGLVISFSPVIYIAAALFAFGTAYIGAIRPAGKAARISPIEAQKYTGDIAKDQTVKIRKPLRGKIYRMAIRNIFRDRKSAVIVFLSLFLGITTFIVVTTIISSMTPENYIASYYKNDIVLNYINAGYGEAVEQRFDDAFMEQIRAVEGVESAVYETRAMLAAENYMDFYEHLKSVFAGDFGGATPQTDAQGNPYTIDNLIEDSKDAFHSIAVGVDKSALLELDEKYDLDAFERGEFMLIATRNPDLLAKLREVQLKNQDGEELGTVKVRGFTDVFFHNNGYSAYPTFVMSTALMERICGECVRTKININSKKGYEDSVLEAVKAMTDADRSITRDSKQEAIEMMNSFKTILYILGGGISVILGLIGVLNFTNVMTIGIIVRKKSMAVMRSVGMTRGQVRRLLVYEGIGYAVITYAFVLTLGNGAAYGLFKLFQKQAGYAVYAPPIAQLAISMAIVALVCVATPLIVYHSFEKTPLSEQIRAGE